MESKYFKIHELVPPETLKSLGSEACWKLFPDALISLLDTIKETLKMTMIINSWGFANKIFDEAPGSPYRYSGYRPKGCGVGVAGGVHYLGYALDIKFYNGKNKLTNAEGVKILLANRDKFKDLRALEININGWNHVDIVGEELSSKRKGVTKGKILLFDPNNVANNKIV